MEQYTSEQAAIKNNNRICRAPWRLQIQRRWNLGKVLSFLAGSSVITMHPLDPPKARERRVSRLYRSCSYVTGQKRSPACVQPSATL